MIKNYIKTAWRSMSANKLFTLLNIAGLAIGIGVCITLFACIYYELSFDRMYKNAGRIYRVNMQTTAQFDYGIWSELPNAVGPAMVQNLPQVQAVARLIKHDFGAPASLKAGEQVFTEKGLYLADSTAFRLFDFHFIEGNARTAFAQPKSIVLSESAKRRLYGNAPAVGQLIYVNNRDTLQVSGVYQDLPANSTIDCDMLYNIMDSWMGKEVLWGNASYETYCLLRPGAGIKQVEAQASHLIDRNVKKEDQYFTRFLLQPLAAIHLYSADIRAGYSTRLGSIGTVKVLITLSLLVLLIACINYMNLATARSQKRAKSVGVNKVLGADRLRLLGLFYTETAVLSGIAIVIGYLLSLLMQPLFLVVTGIEVQASALFAAPVLLSLLLCWLFITVAAGSYPAFSLSGISPLVLMSKLKLKNSTADFIRRSLVVFQFAASIILIIAVIVILQQITFIKNKNLGYNPNGVVAVSIKAARERQQVAALIHDISSVPGVVSTSAVQSVPGDVESGKSVRKLYTDKEGYPVKTCRTDGAITKTLHLSLLAGSSLPSALAETDTSCYVLINENVMKYLGFKTPQAAIGRYIYTEMQPKSLVVGVVKDFNYQSLKNDIGGYVYYEMNRGESLRTLLVRYDTRNLTPFVQQLHEKFKAALPNSSFDYEFLDTHVQNLYLSEQHTASTVTVFSTLAIFIACLGLFGLAAFIAEQRTKEIGIRKVLGASVPRITRLLAGDFMKLVGFSILIASPVAWYVMNKWLMGFSYRVQINAWAFIIAGATAIAFALLTVSSHALKAAVANPVKSLRSE